MGALSENYRSHLFALHAAQNGLGHLALQA